MVENAYKITLVTAFVPLCTGIYWKRANSYGAVLSIILGLLSWLLLEFFMPKALIPPQLGGLLMSVAGMILGTYFASYLHVLWENLLRRTRLLYSVCVTKKG